MEGFTSELTLQKRSHAEFLWPKSCYISLKQRDSLIILSFHDDQREDEFITISNDHSLNVGTL